ncbi:MepB family protein [Rugamonas sp. DEMB1]|uniref:MepB family protein n=1 Tax=Rugamonas sp. DEMB1 TaxID=3039386 RepID=UPI002447CC3F|nr:MepB family protein [Rugamonas sp. DEMB1]WGG53293.1 MepB family protein [Rugamonas sp. DEMB1]
MGNSTDVVGEAGEFADPARGALPAQLVAALAGAYRDAGLASSAAPAREAESAEYGACRLGLAGLSVAFRVAKTTPTKIGQFVTIWKRPTPQAEIAPLDGADGVDVVVVSVAEAGPGGRHGQFVFDREVLLAKGVMSRGGVGGKRALRVYPPWTVPLAKDAIRTQQWQLRHFLPLRADGGADPARLRALLGI